MSLINILMDSDCKRSKLLSRKDCNTIVVTNRCIERSENIDYCITIAVGGEDSVHNFNLKGMNKQTSHVYAD